MPELPEVEVTRRQIAPYLLCREIDALATTTPSRFFLTSPRSLTRRLVGRRVVALDRHGKYLIATLDDRSRLVLHLGMTGRLLADLPPATVAPGDLAPAANAPVSAVQSDRHVHLRLAFRDGGPAVCFRDPRRFGRVEWLAPGAPSARLDRLGVDALAVESAALHAVLARRRAPLKALLLDQTVLAGVGNIYADEALFAAGLRPTRPGARTSRAAVSTLVAALGAILRASIARGGTTIHDFAAPDGAGGAFAAELRVYGRTGEPCGHCGAAIRRVVIGGRSTHFCPHCQR